MKQKKSVEDYLKTIYVLSGKKGCAWGGYSKGDRRFAAYCLRVLKGIGRGRVHSHG